MKNVKFLQELMRLTTGKKLKLLLSYYQIVEELKNKIFIILITIKT